MIINRIGKFLLLIGMGLIFLFLLSDIARSPDFNLLILGGLVSIAGILLIWSNPPPPPPPSGRLGLFRRKKKEEEKKKPG